MFLNTALSGGSPPRLGAAVVVGNSQLITVVVGNSQIKRVQLRECLDARHVLQRTLLNQQYFQSGQVRNGRGQIFQLFAPGICQLLKRRQSVQGIRQPLERLGT